MDLEPGI